MLIEQNNWRFTVSENGNVCTYQNNDTVIYPLIDKMVKLIFSQSTPSY